MTKVIFIVFYLIFVSGIFGESLQVPIKEVLVYNDRAQVTRKLEKVFQPGESIYQIVGLPVGLLDENLRAYIEGTDKAKVLSINSYIEPHLHYNEGVVKTLNDDIDEKERMKKSLFTKIQNSLQEKKVLDGFEKLTMESISKKVAYIKDKEEMQNWQATLMSFRGKHLKIERDLHKLYHQLGEINKAIEIQKKKLDEVVSKANKAKRITEVKVNNITNDSIKAELNLSYIILGASWMPVYNVSIKKNERAELEYMADILQETGEDWKNVKISLSTAEPRKIQVRPKIRALEMLKEGGKTKKDYYQYSQDSKEEDMAESKPEDISTPASTIEGNVSKTAASIVFHSPEISTIPSIKEYHRILISKYKSKVEFEYKTIPKIRKAVYLIAKLKNNIRFPLLPGNVNIFRQSGFIGKTGISYTPAFADFEVSLGIELDFRVFYRLESNSYKSGIVNTEKVFEKIEYITIENFSKKKQSIAIISNIPVSDISDIEIELDKEFTTAGFIEKVKNSGIITWKIPLESFTKRGVVLRYKIKAPKNSNLNF